MNPAQKEAVDGAPVPPASASHPLRPPVPLPTPGNVEKFGVKTDGENDMEFWDRDSSALERVKEEMLNSRASNGLGGSNPDYRSLNRMASLEREHFIVDLSGSPKGSVASSPVLIPGQLWPVGSTSTSNSVSMSLAASVAPSMAPSAAMSVGSPGSPPNSLPGTLKRSTTRSKSLLVTASLAPNVSSADPASVIRRGTVKSNKAPSIAGVKRSGTLSRKPSKVKESFQWLDEDPDDSDSVDWNRKETKCTRCFSRWTSLPFLYRYLISNCLGILLLMLPGIINIIFFIENPYSYWVFFIPKKDANGNPIMTLGGFPVFFWSLWASISFFVASTLLYIVPYLPYLILRLAYLIVGKLDQFPITLVQFSRVLNGYIVFLMAASISSVAFGQMLPGATDIGATVAQLLSSTAGVAALWLGIKFGLAVFGRNFQKRIFQSRLDENRFRVFVLERLYAGIKEHLDQTEDLAEPPHTDVEAGKETSNVPRIIEPVATDGLPDQPPELPNQKDGTPPPRPLSPHLSSTLHALSPLLKGMQSALEVVLVGGDKITEQTADRAGVPLGSLKEAKMLARDLWVGLVDLRDHQGKGGKEGVTVEQFYPIFGEGLAEKAFEIFDTDFNGLITKPEMKDSVISTYTTRATLARSMKDSIAAIAKLDSLVGAIGWAITALIYAGLFIDLAQYIAAFAAFWAGFAFAFQPTITKIVEAVIFLFLTHPFDVGDRVTIEGESYFVKELGLMSTILTHVDGREMYASNPILSQKQIFNILRSGGQTESIDLRVSIQTTGEQLKELAERLNAAIREKYMKDFYPTLECFVSKVDWEQETMTIELWLDHRSNFQNGRQRWTRSTTFAKLLRHTVAEVGLEGGKMEVINLEGVSDWFAAVMAEQQERVPVAAGRSRQRMLPEGFADPDLLARTHTPDDADDFEGDEEEAERQQRLGE